MINYIKYRLELIRLKRILSSNSNEFMRAYEKAKKLGFDDGELSYLGQNEDELFKLIKYLQTQYLETVCDKLIIPMPEDGNRDYYELLNFDDNQGDRKILTTAGFQLVRSNIREEKRSRREAFGFWVSMIIGVIGAMIGLVSVFKK